MPPTTKPTSEPRPMPVIVKTLSGNKRLRRVEYRIVRMPEKTGRVQLDKLPRK